LNRIRVSDLGFVLWLFNTALCCHLWVLQVLLYGGGGSLGDRFANEEEEMFWIA
jgi:hypothetical protein